MHLTKEAIRKVIVDSGLVSEADFTTAEGESNRSGNSIPDILIGKNLLSEQVFVESFSDYLGISVVNLERAPLDGAVVERVPELYAKSHGVVLFAFDDATHIGSLGMIDPNDFEAINFLRQKLNAAWLEPHIITSTSLNVGLKLYKQKIGEDFNKIIEENIRASESIKGESGAIDKLIDAVPIVTILDSVLEHAIALAASDIHFEPLETKLLVRYRIDGVLQEILSLPSELTPILIARIKVIANLQIDVHNSPQDGRFRFRQAADIRVSILPTFHGEKAEMRLLRGSTRPLSLSDLGLSQSELPRFYDGIQKPHGLILVTGPTGHGKTTTLYAVLEILNTPKVNITTIEDPIEYDIPRVNQTQVNAKAGVTFATGLRTIVRQNPDIIMIGEIRDTETADIAINAALTGHLLLSTLHTNDAPSAIARMVDLGVQQFLIASTLNVIIAQRLVRRLCTFCVGSREMDETMRKIIIDQAQRFSNITLENLPRTLYKSAGCSVCGYNGYKGQVAIFEVLYVSDAVRDLILANAATHVIRNKAREEGMKTLLEDGIAKAAAGLTSIEEVLRVASE